MAVLFLQDHEAFAACFPWCVGPWARRPAVWAAEVIRAEPWPPSSLATQRAVDALAEAARGGCRGAAALMLGVVDGHNSGLVRVLPPDPGQ